MEIVGYPNAATGPSGTLGRLVDNSASIKSRLDRLTEQSSTGLVSQTYGGLGGAAQVTLDLRPQLARIDTYTQSISAASTRTDVSSQVLQQLRQIAITFSDGTVNLAPQTSQEVDTLAAQAKAALSEVQGLLNTKVGNSYIFAGQDSSNPPLPDTTFNAYVQSIKTAAGGLAMNGGTATAAATLAAATATSPFSTTLGTARVTAGVGFGLTTQVGIVAGQDTFTSQTGPATTGSYVRDLIRSLATISSLNSAQTTLGTNFSDLVSDTKKSLDSQIVAIGDEDAGLGTSKQTLAMNQSALADTQQALTTQISNVENVDIAATATSVTQAQTQLQISYRLISSMQNLSLVQYL